MSNPGKNDPINKSSEVKDSNDKHIGQDFNGYPDAPANPEVINPKTPTEKKTAQVDHKDGEKKLDADKNPDGSPKTDEQDSDGSGGAFSQTEEVDD